MCHTCHKTICTVKTSQRVLSVPDSFRVLRLSDMREKNREKRLSGTLACIPNIIKIECVFVYLCVCLYLCERRRVCLCLHLCVCHQERNFNHSATFVRLSSQPLSWKNFLEQKVVDVVRHIL